MNQQSPIVLYTNLFTLKDKDVKLNRYIDMYYVWLFNIIKYAQLQQNDYCITFIDNITFNHIKNSYIFEWLTSNIYNFRVIIYDTPVNIKEGMLKKYEVDSIINTTDNITIYSPYYMYLDIDVLIIQDIRNIFIDNTDTTNNTNKTTIYIQKEENMIGSDYYGELIKDDELELLNTNNLLHIPGFSAGLYAWKNSKDIRTYFNLILNMANSTTKELYTVEQPFFNAAIFNYLFKEIGIFNFIILKDTTVGLNKLSTQVSKNTTLLNFCGIPGDDSFHWDKILLELFMSSMNK